MYQCQWSIYFLCGFSFSGFKGLRISMKPYQDEGWMENIPLYAISAYFRKKIITFG